MNSIFKWFVIVASVANIDEKINILSFRTFLSFIEIKLNLALILQMRLKRLQTIGYGYSSHLTFAVIYCL